MPNENNKMQITVRQKRRCTIKNETELAYVGQLTALPPVCIKLAKRVYENQWRELGNIEMNCLFFSLNKKKYIFVL